MKYLLFSALSLVFLGGNPSLAAGQASSSSTAAVSSPALPPDYVLGPQDQVSIIFWGDKEMSADVVVRPDGKVSLPLLNDVQAAGYTPEQLRLRLMEAASKYLEEPNASVVVKVVNSRKVFITGNVGKSGEYPLTGSMTILQLIALAGGLFEYADAKNIVVMRVEGGKTTSFKFNYKDVVNQKNVAQNIALRPGDTVVVP